MMAEKMGAPRRTKIASVARCATVLGIAFSLVACPGKKDAVADAAPEASAVAAPVAPAAPAPEAANEGDIKRYPGVETKLDHLPATVEAYVATVRSDASSGASLVAVLKKGTDTQKIGQKDTFYLITFTDPGTPGRKIMGWVDQKAYVPFYWDASKHWITCPGGQAAIVLDIGEQCITPCDPNNDKCAAGQACNGDAPRSDKGTAGSNIEFCVVGVKKGNAPTPTPTTVDAGTTPTPTVVDAGVTPPPPVVDSGAAPPTDFRPLTLPMPVGNLCIPGYKPKAPLCRLACSTTAPCPPSGKCNAGTGMCDPK